jgi:hypothetical protein
MRSAGARREEPIVFCLIGPPLASAERQALARAARAVDARTPCVEPRRFRDRDTGPDVVLVSTDGQAMEGPCKPPGSTSIGGDQVKAWEPDGCREISDACWPSPIRQIRRYEKPQRRPPADGPGKTCVILFEQPVHPPFAGRQSSRVPRSREKLPASHGRSSCIGAVGSFSRSCAW